MTEEQIMKYAELRAHRLMLNGAQKWAFTEKVLKFWTAGAQAESALQEAAKELGHASAA